jgi:acetoin utilization deacetylase AcuC-like enzyme
MIGAGAASCFFPAYLLGKPRSSVPGTGYAYDPRCASYYQNATEVPERVTAINSQIEAAGLLDSLYLIAPVTDPQPAIKRVHTEEHISGIQSITVDETNGATEKIGVIADLAVSYVLGAVRDVCEGKVRNAFCNIRPPGHHQTNNGYPYGYCCYANVVIAARFALDTYGDLIKKVLIVDWDYHHGNGTEALIAGDPSILFYDTCSGSFWNGGDETRHGLMNASSGNEGFLQEWETEMLPLARSFRPDLIIISCGFDSKKYDSMGGLGLTARGFSLLTKKVIDLAQEYSHERIVSILEGGYADSGSTPPTFFGLAQCAQTHVRTLLTGQEQEETPYFTGTTRTAKRSLFVGTPAMVGGELRLNDLNADIRRVRVTDLHGAVVYSRKVPKGCTVINLGKKCSKSIMAVGIQYNDGTWRFFRWKNY